MPIVRSYKCNDHGYFDGWDEDNACPHCGTACVQVFIKPFAIKSGRTKHADKTLKQLASDYKMTDIKSVREGESQAGTYRHGNQPAPQPSAPRPGDAVMWGGAGSYNMNSLLSGGGPKSVGGEATGFNPRDMGNVTGPKAIPIARDPQNLTLKDAK